MLQTVSLCLPAMQQLGQKVGQADKVLEAPSNCKPRPTEVRQAGGGAHFIGDVGLLQAWAEVNK
jgi:hypothetical protein